MTSVCFYKEINALLHRNSGAGVGAAMDSIGNFWTLEYILPLVVVYSRVLHTRVGRTLEYATPG